MSSPTTRFPRPMALLLMAGLAVAVPHVPRQPSETLPMRALDVVPFPTPAARLMARQAQNQVCGWIDGDPSNPATCAAGSRCMLDVVNRVVGCCPEAGVCSTGIYTGCVDGGSGAQAAVDPYVSTCSGSDTCYQLTFDGGYRQFACGTGTGTRVATTTTPRGGDVTLTGTSTATGVGSGASPDEEGNATTSPTSTSTSSPAQDDNGDDKTGVIIGSSLSGAAFVVFTASLGLYLWRKRGNTRKGPGRDGGSKYISPVSGFKLLRNEDNMAAGMTEARGIPPTIYPGQGSPGVHVTEYQGASGSGQYSDTTPLTRGDELGGPGEQHPYSDNLSRIGEEEDARSRMSGVGTSRYGSRVGDNRAAT